MEYRGPVLKLDQVSVDEHLCGWVLVDEQDRVQLDKDISDSKPHQGGNCPRDDRQPPKSRRQHAGAYLSLVARIAVHNGICEEGGSIGSRYIPRIDC